MVEVKTITGIENIEKSLKLAAMGIEADDIMVMVNGSDDYTKGAELVKKYFHLSDKKFNKNESYLEITNTGKAFFRKCASVNLFDNPYGDIGKVCFEGHSVRAAAYESCRFGMMSRKYEGVFCYTKATTILAVKA